MPYCAACGAHVETADNFCTSCGSATVHQKGGAPTPVQTAAGDATGVVAAILIGLFLATLMTMGVVSSHEKAPRVSPETASQREENNRCFLKGKALASVYVANISQAAEVGLEASRVMEEGCNQESGSACQRNCKLGFRATVKEMLR